MGKIFFISIVVSLTAPFTFASEDIRSYDQIVRELSGGSVSSKATDAGLKFEDIRFHIAVGAIGSRMSLKSDKGMPTTKNMRGAELVVGIDLFTRDWLAEGAIRTYTRQEFMETDVSLREFDMRLVHEHSMSRQSIIRAGAGIATRYLNFGASPAIGVSRSQTTPAMLALLGYKHNIVNNLMVSADLGYRSSFVDDTDDEGSVDASLRIGGTF